MLTDADTLPTISTERLRLRSLTPGDVPALAAIFGDSEVCRFWSHAALTDAGAQALYDHIVKCFAARSLFQWGIAERESDSVVGTCTLAALSSEHRRAELGFALARASWGRGYMAEVLPALVDFAFETLDLHRLEADIDPRNQRSIRAIQRLGFKSEGYLRERYHVNGEVQDTILYGLLRRDWVSRREMSDEVRLRNVEPNDLPIFYEQQLDADATRMAAFPARDRAAFDAHWATNILGNPAAVTQTIVVDGQVVGNIGSWPQDGARLVGYWIGKEHWGKGVATRALAAFLHLVTERPLYAHVAKHNVGSIRVLEKCGFSFEREESIEPVGEDVAELVLVLS